MYLEKISWCQVRKIKKNEQIGIIGIDENKKNVKKNFSQEIKLKEIQIFV